MKVDTLKTFEQVFGYTNAVAVRKPIRSPGQDKRDLPNYTIPEAAAFLAVPEDTLHKWYSGETAYFAPSAKSGRAALLSFRDICEAYALQVLRKVHRVKMAGMRETLQDARHETGTRYPLMHPATRLMGRQLIVQPRRRGKRGQSPVDVSAGGQLTFKDVLDVIGKRIVVDGRRIPFRLHPWYKLKSDPEAAPVSMEPNVMSGSLVVTGTRVPVQTILGCKLSGQPIREIAEDFGIPESVVKKAIQHLGQSLHKAA